MNLEKTRHQIDKIRHFLEAVSGDGVSHLEKDLLKKYIRDLYDLVSGEEAPASETVHPAPRAEKKEVPVFVEVPAPEVPVIPPKPIEVPAPEPLHVPKEPTMQPVPEPVTIPREPERHEGPKTEPIPRHQPETPPIPSVSPEERRFSVDISRFARLFDINMGNDLSERLSSQRIEDIGRSLGLNDRIQLTNELFGGDNQVFQEVISRLNSFQHFQQAQTYLSERVADRFQWLEEERLETAKEFIKLIKRKYA